MATNVSTTLGWVDPSESGLDWVVENWGAVTASLPAISQFPGLISIELSNNTVYDTLRTNSMVGYAMVNATTITSNCGLLPNVTYSRDTGRATAPFGNGNTVIITATLPWTDQIQVLQPFGIIDQQTSTQPSVLLMVSTLLEIEPSVRKEVAVPMTWESFLPLTAQSLIPVQSSTPVQSSPSSPSTMSGPPWNQTFDVYFIQCSLSTNNTTVAIDMQTNTLQNPMPISQLSTQWEEIHQWTSTPWSRFMSQVLSTSGGSGCQFAGSNEHISEPTIVDEYIMSLVGLNLAAQYDRWTVNEHPISNFTLSLDKLEAAIAKTVAQLTWMSTRMGSNGGVPPGEGMALVDEEVISLRLNITLIPLLFATSASVIMLGLALHTTRAFDASHNSQAAIQSIGVLQLLWLGNHSPSVHEAFEHMEHPTEANLRRAGMIDVCFAMATSDEEELSMRSSTDGLFVQGVDYSRDNGV